MTEIRPTKDEVIAAEAELAVDGKNSAAAFDVLRREARHVRDVAIDITTLERTIVCPNCKTEHQIAVPLVQLTQVMNERT